MTECSVPAIPLSKKYIDDVDNIWHLPWAESAFCNGSMMPDGASSTPSCSFSKESLAKVRVLGQVDRKFIACLIDTDCHSGEELESSGSQRLVLVDQHAADERIRVERYLRSLCLGYLDRDGVGVERRNLSPPVPVLVTEYERDRLISLAKAKRAFHDWGFDLVEDASNSAHRASKNDEGYGIVHCTSIPEVISEKV